MEERVAISSGVMMYFGLSSTYSIVMAQAEMDDKPTCPECGSENILIAGHCFTCYDCGFSMCSL